MHSTQPLLNRAGNHSKAMNLGPLVFILCALVTVLSVLVGNLYHQQNQYRELLTNEAPVSKEIALRSMAPMVMNHQTMFEGSQMDMNKLVAEEFTEDSAQYLTDLYKEHFGEDDFEEDDFEEVAVGGPFQKFRDAFKGTTGQTVKIMKKSVYAIVRAILVMFYKINISLNQVTAGTKGLNLQFTFAEDATALIKSLTDKANEAKVDVEGGTDAKTFYAKTKTKFFNLAAKAIAAYRHFVCNTGVRLKGFQILLSTSLKIGFNVLLDTDMDVVKAFTAQFDAPELPATVQQCANVPTALGIKDYSKEKEQFADEQTFFPFDCPECEKDSETDLSGKSSDRQS